MTIDGYASRNIPSFKIYESMLERRMQAKKAGDKSLANALKLVANTTYGAMLNKYNELYDPLMGRSVCVTGQLRLLELANHLLADCKTLKVIQLNTDGIMVSFEEEEYPTVLAITKEWQTRTGFELEEDKVKKIVQKDVNNYIEIAENGELKVKGGVLVRGVVTNGKADFPAMGFPDWKNLMGGAFKINNNAVIVSDAVIKCLAYGTPVEETIAESDNIFDFQIIAKCWSKCGNAYHDTYRGMDKVQRVNRVYAVDDFDYGTLYQFDPDTQNYRKVSGLPSNLKVDNDNRLKLSDIDRKWYIRLANRYVQDFYGVKDKRDREQTKRVNRLKKQMLACLRED